jgi:hypothetical protein
MLKHLLLCKGLVFQKLLLTAYSLLFSMTHTKLGQGFGIQLLIMEAHAGWFHFMALAGAMEQVQQFGP